MFTSCLWQLWDWIDPQFATMDSKKLQALQQANSHLAPMPQTKPPGLQHHHDFRPTRSPVFQNYPQYQSLASNFATHINMTNNPQEQAALHKAAALQNSSSAQLGYHDQIYQSANAPDKIYHQSRLAAHFPAVHQQQASNLRLQQQFHALEQEKIQQQIRTQNEALMHQQQTFAMRQQMNPPVPSFPSQTSSMSNMSSLNNVPQTMMNNTTNTNNNRNLPPSSLNIQNQYQPAQSPLKINNTIQAQQHQILMLQNERQLAQQRQIHAVQQLYHHQQQMHLQQTPTDVPMIQQNIPGQVVNQAVQTQLSGMKTTTSSGSMKSPETSSTTPSTPATPSTPTHAPLEKRKSEPVHSLKSPVAKRHPNAPVALSGWLWKQGSEGLKVWRKRWFVLSEYILFYYKGPEEEKIMGSVLLPSYKISACTPDDKANRKYAFKCEHTNMRTYVLAAESGETLIQWVKALTMAAMMQGSSESESQPSITSSYNNPSFGDNSGDSGIHTFQSQQTKLGNGGSNNVGPVTPASDNSHQPLYANAPPKPRRATDCGYSSPSPENAMDQYGQMRQMRQDPIYGYKQPPQQQQPPPPVINRSTTKTPDPVLMQRMQQMRLEQNKSPSALKSPPSTLPHRSALEQEQYMQKLMLHQQQLQQQQKYLANTMPMAYNNNSERRTPDTYGPSARRQFGDYEDIYQLGKNGGQVMPQIAQQQQPPTHDMAYRRPMSPTKYDNNMQIPPMPQRYTPNFLEQSTNHQQVSMRNKPSLSLARPHSADFLEYEARNPVTTRMKAEPAQAPRPKSSLDINRSQDNVYYSESNYAEKMRQSALYLQKQNPAVPNNNSKGMNDPYYNRQDETSSIHPSMSSQTLQREIDMVRANRYEISDDIHNGSASVPRVRHAGKNHQQQQQQQQLSQQEQFLRSASARLPTKKGEEDPNRLDGERKREESMKRLLEWKQRMLQSPLTRKGPQLTVPPPNGPMNTQSLHLPPKSPLTIQQNQAYYQQQTMNDVQKSNHALQRSRSDSHAAFPNEDSSEDEASVSVRNIRNIPKVPLTVKPTDPNDTLNLNRNINVHMNGTGGNSNNNNNSNFYYGTNYIKPSDSIYTNGQIQQQPQVHQQEPIQHQYAVVKKTGSKRDIRENLERENSAIFKNLNVSAGDLLNRTHEELILLLIQLRKETSSTARSIEQCCTEIHEVQNRIRTAEGQERAQQAERLEKLKLQLSELEKQYEKSKPLVNLVDNMVKLGSLYRGGNQRYPNETTTLDRLEFNQRIQERRLMQEEQRQWERMSPNQTELQTKVQQLYKLDQALQEESGTLQNLQRDKEDLERALYGLRSKLQNENAPLVVEAARRQQHALEMELSRVHQLLAENSKKLEQTVASNARLEQELLVLRQKLQQSRDSKNFQSNLNHDSGNGQTAALETELRRVQQLVGDMQRQRQELSQAVRELTDSSNTIYQEMNRNVTGIKKRTSSTSWTETDLDSMDHSRTSDSLSESQIPLFIDTMSSSMNSNNIVNCSSSSKLEDYDINKLMNGKIMNGFTDEIIDSMALENDDFEGSAFSNLTQQEKQEIKTVRIVKRESERRQRDRERNGLFSTQNLDQVLEEEAQLFNSAINSDSYNAYQRSRSLPRGGNGSGYIETHEIYNQTPNMQQYQLQSKYMGGNDYYNSLNMQSNAYPVSVIDRVADLYSDTSSQMTQIEKSYTTNYYPSNNGNLSQKAESIQSLTKTLGELSPVFQSEAARQIIIEMSSGNSGDDENVKVPNANKQRRAIPKEKRRHFTAPHHVNAKTVQTIQSENDMNKNNVNYRARDDLDMEVALRPRINAPDVVRSALGPREKISENTIDNLFGAPNKILIPERYIPEQAPELSPEEKRKRQEKVEAIKKMLSDTTPTISGNDIALPPSQLSAEKKQREHLLQLNQILAQQVMQMSKIVAEKAMAVLPSKISELEDERELSQSPVDPLPIYQQRDNYFS
ncbi:uncharacterized protein kmr isoform X12 [Chironomus tepperi]|uniref:uncharacterized protein kmr isoform X12 n=1 Tax=Chironomus tepperi TaxID=113505 RepID=UPI00391F31C1